MRRLFAGGVAAAAAVSLTLPTMSSGAPADDNPTPAQLDALSTGLPLAPKSSTRPAAQGVNPLLANLPDLSKVDYAAWKERLHAAGKKRAGSAALAATQRASDPNAVDVPPFVHDEQEPARSSGSNETPANAERISAFGTGTARNNRARILGELAALPTPSVQPMTVANEDNGSFDLATETGITGNAARTAESVLGDGPHGPEANGGDGSNDFDVYKLQVTGGRTVEADTAGSPSGTDTVIALYSADGEPVAVNDDVAFGDLSSQLSYKPAAAGTYYLLVGGYSPAGPLPEDPTDSGSGAGGADTGNYKVTIRSSLLDTDHYAVRLRPGDTIGGVANGSATTLGITKPDGTQMVRGAFTDASSLYPPSSPLPGGGNTTVAYVAEEAGWYALEVSSAETGAYAVTVEAYRPGTLREGTQTVLLDFRGGRVNTAIWGGPGPRTLSPFSAFIAKWGIPRAEERRLERRITATVQRNIDNEIEARGLNPNVNVEVLTTRTNPELIGKPNVSQVHVAGTIAESGISTIGIAQYIDPGNFGHEDQSIVLLDVLSNPAGPISSLNTFMNDDSDRVKFVSAAVGNVIAHEVGHTIGNYHTDFADDVPNVMDSGGGFFAENLFGVGPDNVGGTADDPNVRFVTDTYSPAEGFTGLENTLNVTAWANAGR